jgi:hypothetical protein
MGIESNVLVEGDAAGRAGLRGVELTRAARTAVGRVRVDQAGGLASDGEAGGIEGALELRRAVRAEVDGAVRDAAALVVRDPHGEVVSVAGGTPVPVRASQRRPPLQAPLRQARAPTGLEKSQLRRP